MDVYEFNQIMFVVCALQALCITCYLLRNWLFKE